MLSNFCHALWDTRIECDSVSSDGYEIDNLISRDHERKKKGFLAARFVKPVVSVLVSFPFPVDICAVNINPQVGAQNTRGVEMFSASLKPRTVETTKLTKEASQSTDNCTKINKHEFNTKNVLASNGGKHGPEMTTFHSYEYELNVNNVKEKFKNCFVQILRVQIPEGHVGNFVNPCFPSLPDHCESSILKNGSANILKCMLQQGHFLRCISHLVIRITQVHNCSVPCFRTVEIFAQPAKNCGKFVTNYATIISSRLEQEKQNTRSRLFSKKPSLDMSVTTDMLGSSKSGTQEIAVDKCVPEDFIDPITLDIMTLPLLLPSGTTIDRTTLDRHITSERNWGRPPSDPFTGLPLGSKVVPNVALKCRIDKYLLSSDICVNNLGRTVGSSSDQISTTKLKLDAIKEQKGQQTKRTTFSSKRPMLDTNNTQPFKKKKTAINQSSKYVSGSLDIALEEALSVTRNQPIITMKNISMSSLIPTSKLGGSETTNVIEQRANLADQPAADGSTGCPHQSNTLFQLPCKHIICRDCLVTCAAKTNQCPNCKSTFDKRNVVRVYSRTTQS